MAKAIVRNSLLIAAGAGLAFVIFSLTSHPRSKVHRALPQKKIKNLQVFPHIKIVTKDTTYHFHHWLIFSTLYWRLFLKKRVFNSKFLHGIMLGSIFQGLLYKDRFRILYRNEENQTHPAVDGSGE